MSLPRRLRVAPALFAFLLSAPPLLATPREVPRSPELARPGLEGLLVLAWDRLGRIWEKEGSSTDPFGLPKTSAPPSPAGQNTPVVSPK
jgi:hypothetical protein